MTPELKAQWVAALRSEKYKQGIGLLRNRHDEYCCLGVLCELAGLATSRTAKDDWIFEASTKLAPADLLDVEIQRELAEHNDEEVPFGQIAGLIEADTRF